MSVDAIGAAVRKEGAQPSANGRLRKAVQEFEALLLAQCLEKLQESVKLETEGSDPGAGTLSGLGTQAVASALASRGGLGLGELMLRQLEKHEIAPKVP